jgi:hypothetical protein
MELGNFPNEDEEMESEDSYVHVHCDDVGLQALSAAVRKTGGVLQVSRGQWGQWSNQRHDHDMQWASAYGEAHNVETDPICKHGARGDPSVCGIAAEKDECMIQSIIAKWPTPDAVER